MSHAVTRRTFLQTSTAALAASTTIDALAQAPPPRTPRVDAHLHCFAGADDPRFPYHARAPYRPAEPATPEHLLACMDAAGVDYAVVVHPEPYQDDHRYLEHCLAVGDGRLKGTILLFADRAGSIDRLPKLASDLAIVAARVHAYAPDRLPPFDSPELKRLWRLATDAGLAMQIHFEPRYAAGFEPLIREFSETTVVIDHLGRPFQGTPEEHETVVRWARFPNTVMKLSAIPDNRSYPHRDIRPVIRRLTEEFGPERMLYGGGFGAAATAESYAAAFERARSYLDHLSPADQDQILGGTAARLFGFRKA